MPAQAHQLVEAISRDGEAQPHEKVNVEAHFENEPKATVNSGIKGFRDGDDDGREEDKTNDKTKSRDGQHKHLLHARRLLWRAHDAIGGDSYQRSEETRLNSSH